MTARSESLVARVLPIAVLAVIAVVVLIPALFEVIGRSESAAAMGGDFPSFFSAGSIVLDGEIDSLYDPAVQRMYQEGFHGEGEYLFFAYPPFVAIGYAAIAWLPYGVAFALHAAMSIAALIGACWLALGQIAPGANLRQRVVVASAVAIVSYPILRAVLGGQNTAFSLVLITGVWWACEKDRTILAGVLVVGLMAKPQFALVLLVILVLARKWRVVATAMAGSIVLYLATAVVVGWAWPKDWLDQVVAFGDVNGVVNSSLMVNVTGWATAALPEGAVASGIVVVLFGAVLCLAVWTVFRAGLRWPSFAVLASAVVLLSPSALFYDAGIALFAFGVVSALVMDRPWWAVGMAAIAWVQVFEPLLGWSPLFILVLAALVASVSTLGEGAERVTPRRYTRRAGDADGGESTWRVTE